MYCKVLVHFCTKVAPDLRKLLRKQIQINYLDTNFHPTNSPFLLPHVTFSRDRENFFIHQRNSCWVIISFILMTEKALILQREI